MTDLFDASAMYDGDYLHFLAVPINPADGSGDPRSDADADLARRLLGLEPGSTVLDVGCGHGRIANRLAAHGARVTGIDVSAPFLDRARSDAAALGVQVDYRPGDMRDLGDHLVRHEGGFDAVVSWSTAFGYFDDTTNREVLHQMRGVLRPGGRLVMDLNNLVARLRDLTASRVAAQSGPHDLLLDRYQLDPATSRLQVTRTVVRDGRARELGFVVRLFGFPELRDWLAAAGFTAVTACGEDGAPLTALHERMVVTATAGP